MRPIVDSVMVGLDPRIQVFLQGTQRTLVSYLLPPLRLQTGPKFVYRGAGAEHRAHPIERQECYGPAISHETDGLVALEVWPIYVNPHNLVQECVRTHLLQAVWRFQVAVIQQLRSANGVQPRVFSVCVL